MTGVLINAADIGGLKPIEAKLLLHLAPLKETLKECVMCVAERGSGAEWHLVVHLGNLFERNVHTLQAKPTPVIFEDANVTNMLRRVRFLKMEANTMCNNPSAFSDGPCAVGLLQTFFGLTYVMEYQRTLEAYAIMTTEQQEYSTTFKAIMYGILVLKAWADGDSVKSQEYIAAIVKEAEARTIQA